MLRSLRVSLLFPLVFLFFVVLTLVLAAPRSAWAATPAVAATPPGPSDGLTAEPSLDRGTPRRAFEGFLRAGGSGDGLRAAHYLDLRSIPAADQATKGAVLAQQLWYVTTHVGRFDLLTISDDAEAALPKGETALLVGTLDDRDGPVPIAMQRVKFPDGVERWIFARPTLAIAPALYATLARPEWAASLPAWANGVFIGNAVWQWLGIFAAIPLAYLGARLLVALLLGAAGALARRTATLADDLLVKRLKRPMRIAVSAILFRVAVSQLVLTELVNGVVAHVTFTMLVVAGALTALRVVDALTHWRQDRFPRGRGGDAAENRESVAFQRASRTRAALYERLAAMFVTLIAIALGLLQFEIVRGVGASLLASAGLAGIVIGFAAQRSLGAIIGGVQLSLTQPVRIGDAVYIDGEHGTIDHIYLTHVVVRRWDDRRVVFPVARFLDQSFQNLSKFGSDQTGVVTFTCDARQPIDALREELRRICSASPLWDKRVCALEITDFASSSVTLRALVSAADPFTCEKLRCEVREGLAASLHHAASPPESIGRQRKTGS